MSSLRLTKIDELTRGDHVRLRKEDVCYYLHEYTSGQSWSYSEANQLISNLKKRTDRRGRSDWKYKQRAIRQVAEEFLQAVDPKWFDGALIVPLPPSAAKGDPAHDDRMVQVAQLVAARSTAEVRELITQIDSVPAYHSTEDPRDPETIAANWSVHTQQITKQPNVVVALDDVITTGGHFRAAKLVLEPCFPARPIVGFFVARRVFPPDPMKDRWDEFVRNLTSTAKH